MRVVGQLHSRLVSFRDHVGLDQFLAHPLEQPAPVPSAYQHDRHVPGLAGLRQGQHLEEFVEGAEAAGETTNALA